MELKIGKRSNFIRYERDFYPTPLAAVKPLIDHLDDYNTFAEPCAGDGALIDHIYELDSILRCLWASDIEPQKSGIKQFDALELTYNDLKDCDVIVSNTPWDRKLLHPMIDHFRVLKPTWLLFDSDWCYTKQSAPYMKYCSDIVAVGRVKWIPDSKMTGKDNCAWYKFVEQPTSTTFHGRQND